MNKFIMTGLSWLCMAGLTWGGNTGDVNGDGAVGLPEAVHALQVASGIRPQVVRKATDFTEYFFVENSSYRYRVTPVGGAALYPTDLQTQTTAETINGKAYLGLDSLTTQWGMTSTAKNYYLAGTSEIAWAGYQISSPTPATKWMSPAVVIGSKNMDKGDGFYNFFSITDPAMPSMTTGLHYEEYVFVGTEDVSVPAGNFSNCLKILNRTAEGVYLRYYAKNVGLVKQIYSSNNPTMTSGYAQELLFAANNMTVNCTGQGVWNDPDYASTGRSSQLVFTSYRSPDNKFKALLELKDFSGPIVPSTSLTFSMVSSDGAHFASDPDVYGLDAPLLSITMSNFVLSGSYTATPTTITVPGETLTLPARVVALAGTAACSP